MCGFFAIQFSLMSKEMSCFCSIRTVKVTTIPISEIENIKKIHMWSIDSKPNITEINWNTGVSLYKRLDEWDSLKHCVLHIYDKTYLATKPPFKSWFREIYDAYFINEIGWRHSKSRVNGFNESKIAYGCIDQMKENSPNERCSIFKYL